MLQYLQSRTVWTFIVLFVISGVAGVHTQVVALFGQSGTILLDGVLTALGIYFRVNPQASFTPKQ